MCIDDEISFEIPESWVWVRLEDISFVGTGSTPDRTNKEYYTGSIPWVNSSLTQNDYILQTPEFISEKAIEETSCRIYPIGTLIVAMYGQGKTRGQVSELKIAAATNQACAAIQVYNCDIKTFVKLFFKYNYTTIRRKASGGAQPNLNLLKIKKIVLPLPPLAEQKRIVAKIEELMPILHKYDKAQKVLDELNGAMPVRLRQSILQEAIQGKLIPQDPNDEPASVLLDKIRAEKVRLVKEGKLKKKDIIDSIIFKGDDNKYYEQIGQEAHEITEDLPFEIPYNWEWCRLRDVCSIFTGATFRKDETNSDCHGIRILRGGNIMPFEIMQKADDIFLAQEQVKESILLKQNDIITPAVTSLENIGKMARVEQDMPDVTVGGFVFVLRPHYSNKWLAKYLLYFMSSPSAIEFMKSITNKSGQAFYNIGKERLATTLIPLPPKEEEKRIVVKIDRLFDRIRD